MRRLALTLPLALDWGCCGWLLRRLIVFPLESASRVEHDLRNATYQQGPRECGSCKYSVRCQVNETRKMEKQSKMFYAPFILCF